MSLPGNWLKTRLGEKLSRVDTKIDPQNSSVQTHFYIGLEHIESHTGRLLRDVDDVTEGADILSIKTVFRKGDILYGKLRPNLNKVHLAEQDGICSTDIWALRASGELIPEFALHYLRSPAVYARATQLAVGGNLPRLSADSFDRIPFLLPTLPEQQCIVEVLRQAETVANQQQPRRQQLDLMIKAYLDRLVLAIDESEWTQLSDLVETRYGTSVSADAEADSGTPVLRIPNVAGGEVDTTDMKYVELSDAERDRLRLTKADVLIVRSNGNPDYVGRSAPITEDVEQDGMVYASYLIRLRANTDRLLPEYLSAFLNSAFGRAAMRNAIRTTAGQSNLSGGNLTKIRIPLPTITQQKKFAAFWHEVRLLRRLISQSEQLAKQVQAELTIFALSGELTAKWREEHQQEIVAATIERDKTLREHGTKLSASFTEIAPRERPTSFSRPARHWLVNELSEFQFEVWSMLRYEWRGSVVVDDPSVFDDFCTNPQIAWRIEHFKDSPNRIRRTLEQLAALGLIAKVSLPKEDSLTKQMEYLIAYRPLREDENTGSADVAYLRRKIGIDKLEGSS